jgi:hypothetical protein
VDAVAATNPSPTKSSAPPNVVSAWISLRPVVKSPSATPRPANRAVRVHRSATAPAARAHQDRSHEPQPHDRQRANARGVKSISLEEPFILQERPNDPERLDGGGERGQGRSSVEPQVRPDDVHQDEADHDGQAQERQDDAPEASRRRAVLENGRVQDQDC